MLKLSHNLDQLDLDIYRLFHKAASKYTLLSSAHGTLSSKGHVIEHKTSLSKIKKKCIQTIFSHYNDIKQEINKRKDRKPTHMWKLK